MVELRPCRPSTGVSSPPSRKPRKKSQKNLPGPSGPEFQKSPENRSLPNDNKFLTIQFAKFPNLIVMEFPIKKKQRFGTISVDFAPPQPLPKRNFFLYCRFGVSEKRSESPKSLQKNVISGTCRPFGLYWRLWAGSPRKTFVETFSRFSARTASSRKRQFVHKMFVHNFCAHQPTPPPNQQNDGCPLEFLLKGPRTELRTLRRNCEQSLQ